MKVGFGNHPEPRVTTPGRQYSPAALHPHLLMQFPLLPSLWATLKAEANVRGVGESRSEPQAPPPLHSSKSGLPVSEVLQPHPHPIPTPAAEPPLPCWWLASLTLRGSLLPPDWAVPLRHGSY